MTIALLALAVLVLSAVSLRALRNDTRPAAPPRSHEVDTDFVAPAMRNDFHRAA